MKNAKNRLRPRPPKSDAARKTAPPGNAVSVASALVVILVAVTLIGVPALLKRSDPSIASVQAATSPTPEAPPQAPPLDTTNATRAVSTATAARVRTPDAPVTSKEMVESPRTTAVETAQHPDAIPHANAIRHANPRLPADSAPIGKLAAPADSTPNAKPTPHADPLTTTQAMNEDAVTISGCLQASDDSFWLTDTSGTSAPKSRSWKSGFLKKHAESVQVVAATRALQLSNYAAQRVTATGTLAKRTMQARSLERIAGSCH